MGATGSTCFWIPIPSVGYPNYKGKTLGDLIRGGCPSTSRDGKPSCWDDRGDTEPTLNRKAMLTVARGSQGRLTPSFLSLCPFHDPLLIKQLLQHKTKQHEAQAPILSAAFQVIILKPHSNLSSFCWFGITTVATPG